MCYIFLFSYSYKTREWGLRPIRGDDAHEFVCEIHSSVLSNLVLDAEEQRNLDYGLEIQDVKTIPRAPKIIKQPEPAMYDTLKSDTIKFVQIQCLGKF